MKLSYKEVEMNINVVSTVESILMAYTKGHASSEEAMCVLTTTAWSSSDLYTV